MILSNNAFNWAMLRSGLSMGDFIASLTPERETELFKAYNAWRRSKGLAEEAAPATTAPSFAPEKGKESPAPVDDLSALINEVAAEVEEEEAEEAALVHDALDGADEIVGTAPVPVEVEEEIEAAEPVADETVPDDDALMDTEVVAEPEMVPSSAVAAEPEPVAAEAEATDKPAAQSVDFATVIRSLPKEADPALYSRIKDQYGPKTLPMAQVALKEAAAKHRTTAAIRAFIAWLE